MDNDLADRAAEEYVLRSTVKVERTEKVGRCRRVLYTIQTDAKKRIERKVRLACSDIDRLGICRRDRYRTDRQALCTVHKRRPESPAVRRSIESALRGADVYDVGICRMHGDRRDAP